MKNIHTFESFLNESTDEVEMILAKEEDKDRVLRAYHNEKDINLNMTKWSSGFPLGSAKGRLTSLYFANNKSDIETFIKKNNIKVANTSNFDL
jgi:hypothetical protein